MKHLRIAASLCAMLLFAGCASFGNKGLDAARRAQTDGIVQAARSDAIDCTRKDHCAQASPLRELAADAFAASTSQSPRHQALILDHGQDALLARLNLLRSATTRIDLQTYIFDEDDAGQLVLQDLLAAARRGVQVRVLIDQLSALEKVETLAALSGVHRNLEIRVYNPVLGRARLSYPDYVIAAACCWRRLNQRMHSKLLLVDGAVAITGGRNYQNDYYDWDASYNFRDRDLLIAGPQVRAMGENFLQFWDDARSIPAQHLGDVGGYLLRHGVPALPAPHYEVPARVQAMSREADDAELVRTRLNAQAMPIGAIEFLADLPQKHESADAQAAASSHGLRSLIESAREEVLLQTPYLVLSKPAQQMFRAIHAREDAPRVVVSTSSLAGSDSFITYALSYKYKRRYLRDFGFEIHELKPFPEDAPIDLAATGALGDAAARETLSQPADTTRTVRELPLARENLARRYALRSVNRPVPLKRAGVRIGLHAKSLVIDGQIGVIGTHNFDPRGDHYNTESAVVIRDAAFAQRLAESIRRDIAPENSWVIAKRDKSPIFPGIEYTLAKLSERMPVFDLWPVRYATSYEFVPGPQCSVPLSPSDPRFRQCYEPVGDFPEVAAGLKPMLTRIFTAFGAGLAPIL